MDNTYNNYIEYQKYILENIDEPRTRLLNNITVTCACGSSLLLSSYFNHCNSNKHNRYLHNNYIRTIYCIVDSHNI